MSLDFELYVEVDTGGAEPHRVRLYSANITHNLNNMAEAAGIYYPLWRPEEIGIETAEQMIKPLEEGLKLLKLNPASFEQYNSKNGWGLYKNFVPFVERILEACKEHPKAKVYASR